MSPKGPSTRPFSTSANRELCPFVLPVVQNFDMDHQAPFRARLDITGQRYGKLIALEIVDFTKRGTVWRCKCDCGNPKDVPLKDLRSGHTRSCGCLNTERRRATFRDAGHEQLIDMTGQQVGRLHVVQLVRIEGRAAAHWLCQCSCGNTTIVRGDLLRKREIQSCGCYQSEGASDRMTERHWIRIRPFIGTGPIDMSHLSLRKPVT